MATQDIPLSTAEKLSSSNLINNKNLFAKVSQRFGLLPGAQGLNDISQVIEEGTQTVGSGSPLDQVRREAEVVADDVILNFGKEDLKKAPNKFCKTMRRTVKELSARHDIAFKGMVNKLNLDSSNPFQTFVNVADEIFDDGQINWGRIVAVYAFAARLAARDTDKSDFPKKIALFVGKYVANKLGKWILDHGGWVSPRAFESINYYTTTVCVLMEITFVYRRVLLQDSFSFRAANFNIFKTAAVCCTIRSIDCACACNYTSCIRVIHFHRHTMAYSSDRWNGI